MRIVLLTTLCMVCFAMNSVLNRAAVDGGHAEAPAFAVIRVLAGVLVLCALVALRRGTLDISKRPRWIGGAALAAYMIGFSLAYVHLDAGLGALILFGTVQIGMLTYAALTRDPPRGVQLVGIALAFGGLLLALWPSGGALGDAGGAALMVIAGLGWAAYTIAGRGTPDPLVVTGTHFLICLPFVAVLVPIFGVSLTATGWALAIASGAITSGLGYALWYRLLPQLPGALAPVVQLSVPLIAIALGSVLLGEAVGAKLLLSAALVVGGIGIVLRG